MTKIVRIADNQVLTLEDFQRLAKLPRDAMDALITSAVEAAASYAGGTTAKTATTQVTVTTPVYLFKGGFLYSNAEGQNVVLDFLGFLPTSGNKRIVAVLAQAQELNTDTQARDFEVDGSVYPPVMDPQPTETLTWRKANIAYQLGDPAPSPLKPIVDAANTVIAWVTLSSTQVELVEQSIDNRINTLRVVDGRLISVETWRAQTEPVIDGLKSDVAKLLAASRGKVDKAFIGYLLEQLARLNEAVGVSSAASYSKTDYFLDLEDSDTTHLSYVAKVEEGLRFADDNSDRSVLALETPGDTRFQVHSGGLLLPKYSELALLSIIGKDSEVAVSNAGSQTINYVLKTVSRTRVRWGNSFTACTNMQWWQTGRYDPTTGIFRRDGETWLVEGYYQAAALQNHQLIRLQQFWIDTFEDPYWEAITVAASYTGNVSSNTFAMPRSGWIVGVKLGFSRVDTGGDVRLLLCETRPDGSPDYSKALADVTVAAADLKLYPTLTKFALKPIYAEGGKRYAWAIITAGNHWLAMVEGNKFAQGTFFTSTDGVWSQGNIALDACFEVLGAEFEAPRLVINLNDFNLTGGVTDIDLDLEQVVPEGANITYEVQIGSAWYPIQEIGPGNHPLYGLPAAVNARMTLLGTTDLMPGVLVGTSYRRLSRPRVNSTHISAVRTAPANVDEVHVVALLEKYVEANHDCVVSLLTGAGYTTETAAAAVSDQTLPDGAIRRTWTFTGFTPTTTWKRKTVITTTSALSVFHVAEMTDIGFPV